MIKSGTNMFSHSHPTHSVSNIPKSHVRTNDNNTSTESIDKSFTHDELHINQRNIHQIGSSIPKHNRIHIERTDRQINDTFIQIAYSKPLDFNAYSSILLKKFMEFINGMIGAKTNVNYHIQKVRNYVITIPIYVYTNEEAKLDPIDLINKRLKTVREFLENYNWHTANTFQLWLIRSLHIMHIDISTSFNIRTISGSLQFNNIDEPIHIKFPNLSYPTINRITLHDGSTITTYIDPYLEDYGLFLNLSVTFDEMGMSYNALHLYEHLLTKPWDGLNGSDLLELNGATYPVGTCYVYTIHKSQTSLHTYTNATIKWLLQSRDTNFWANKHKEITLETTRTISETRRDRSLTSMGRSDLHAYDINYDTKIFQYWANKPFQILLAGPNIDMNSTVIDHLNNLITKYPIHSDIPRPINQTFKHIPLDVLKMKQITSLHILKGDTKVIIDNFMKNDVQTTSLYGVDCYMKCNDEDLSPYNSILYPILYLNKYYTVDQLNEYIKSHVIPFSARKFSLASTQLKHAGSYLSDTDFEY